MKKTGKPASSVNSDWMNWRLPEGVGWTRTGKEIDVGVWLGVGAGVWVGVGIGIGVDGSRPRVRRRECVGEGEVELRVLAGSAVRVELTEGVLAAGNPIEGSEPW